MTIEALGQIGPKEPTVVPLLIGLLTDKSANIRCAAAWALEQIGPEAKAAVPAPRGLLKDENEDVHKAADEALGDIEGTRRGPKQPPGRAGIF